MPAIRGHLTPGSTLQRQHLQPQGAGCGKVFPFCQHALAGCRALRRAIDDPAPVAALDQQLQLPPLLQVPVGLRDGVLRDQHRRQRALQLQRDQAANGFGLVGGLGDPRIGERGPRLATVEHRQGDLQFGTQQRHAIGLAHARQSG